MAGNPIIDRLNTQIKALQVQFDKFVSSSSRSEWTGGFSRVTYAELPAAGMKGRVYYITDARIGAEGAGAGSGALGVDNGTDWVYANDPTTAVVI